MDFNNNQQASAQQDMQALKLVSEKKAYRYTLAFVMMLFFILLYGVIIILQQRAILELKRNQHRQYQEFVHNLAEAKKIYIYDIEKTLRGIKLDRLNQEFEMKINILGNEVSTAQKKIASLKETKDKDNFSEMYLKSLKLKRDTMIQEYNRTIEDITQEINDVILNIAKEKGAVVIFDKRVIAAQTKGVEDITDEVIERVKITRPKILDE